MASHRLRVLVYLFINDTIGLLNKIHNRFQMHVVSFAEYRF